MIQFTKKLMITGAEQKIRKDGTPYTLVHIMGENGATFACMSKCDINKIMSLKKMEKYDLDFELTLGQYTRLTLNDIK